MTTRIILQAVEGLPVHRRVWNRLLTVLRLRKPACATYRATVTLRAGR